MTAFDRARRVATLRNFNRRGHGLGGCADARSASATANVNASSAPSCVLIDDPFKAHGIVRVGRCPTADETQGPYSGWGKTFNVSRGFRAASASNYFGRSKTALNAVSII